MEWQPIETMPRVCKYDGGSDFLLVLADGQRWRGQWRKLGFETPCYMGRLVPDDEIENLPNYLREWAHPFSEVGGVAGWMPLPNPPKESK